MAVKGTTNMARDSTGIGTVENNNALTENWATPKVNWKPTDRFNYSDYNRIKGNLEHLHEFAVSLYRQFQISDMGEEITSYSAYWDVDMFNLFEQNLEAINENVLLLDIGEPQTFYPNGVFIQWDELNRIESAMLLIKSLLDNQFAGKKRLSFHLGAFKEVKI